MHETFARSDIILIHNVLPTVDGVKAQTNQIREKWNHASSTGTV